MTIQLVNGAEFLHIPKTGGSWVTSVLEKQNLVKQRFGHEHADFDRNLFFSENKAQGDRLRCLDVASFSGRNIGNALKRLSNATKGVSEKKEDIFRFCFVRHPLSWYESWWRFMKDLEWREWGVQNSSKYWHPNSLLNGLGSEDFNDFVWNVVKARPGYVSELLFSYAKPGISFVGKTENLRRDLCDVLDIMGLQYDRDFIGKSQKKNESRNNQKETCWEPTLKNLVMKLELPALIHFDYLTEEDKSILGVDMEIKSNNVLHQPARS